MTYDLTKFDLGAMLKCSLSLREAVAGAPTLEASAQRTCQFLYDHLHGPDTRARARSYAAIKRTRLALSSRISRALLAISWERKPRDQP